MTTRWCGWWRLPFVMGGAGKPSFAALRYRRLGQPMGGEAHRPPVEYQFHHLPSITYYHLSYHLPGSVSEGCHPRMRPTPGGWVLWCLPRALRNRHRNGARMFHMLDALSPCGDVTLRHAVTRTLFAPTRPALAHERYRSDLHQIFFTCTTTPIEGIDASGL